MNQEVFRNQVILITGAASGFGRLLAQKLAGAGAKLALGDCDSNGLQNLDKALRANGSQLVSLDCDVTRSVDMVALVDAAVKAFGRLDIAVNNAGIASPMKSFIEIEEAELDLNFAVNAKGVFFGMQHQIRQMLQQDGGIILNVASLAGIGAAPKMAAYAAAKHAVVGLTKTAAVEYARHNIRINAICPFYSPTPLVTESDLEARQAFLAQGSPMKRLGSPQEMVQAMLALIDPENSYMNGQAIAVDGGVSAY